MRVKQSPAPRCPLHLGVRMEPVPNLKVGAGRGNLHRFGVTQTLWRVDRWRCPVEHCTQVSTREKNNEPKKENLP